MKTKNKNLIARYAYIESYASSYSDSLAHKYTTSMWKDTKKII